MRSLTESKPEGWAAAWASLDHAAAGWIRRSGQAEVLAVASAVIRLCVAERPRQSYEVQVPCHAWWEAHVPALARWLVWRPDWAAALLAEAWADDWLRALDSAGLSLFPNATAVQRMLAGAVCSCTTPDRPCRHILLAFATLARMADTSPRSALRWVGVEVEALLDAAHAQTAVWLQAGAGGACGQTRLPDAPQSDGGIERLAMAAVLTRGAGMRGRLEESAGPQPAGALPADWLPALDTVLWQAWRERHMTWAGVSSGEG
ncbi:MAG: hypothetical protein K6T26_00345 [Alicyclobacillus sp.]|nr:hypothetical protein [Alicyclobacillus sp.]